MHDHSITHLVLESTDPTLAISLEKLKWWLADVLWNEKKKGGEEEEEEEEKEEGKEEQKGGEEMKIFRMKAIMSVAGSDQQHFLQAVCAFSIFCSLFHCSSLLRPFCYVHLFLRFPERVCVSDTFLRTWSISA